MGVDEPMPRWRAHLWHLAPSLLAHVTSLPVDGVLRRWAPIPVAFSTLVVLICVIRRLAGRRVPLWAVGLAVSGPVILWYRSYNAFNYSFRLTNNFCLDKDLCLFLLTPAVVYVAIRWIRAVPHSFLPLALLIPAIVKFHPMTAVYLLLLIPFVVIGYDRSPSWSSIGKSDRRWFSRTRFAGMGMPSRRAAHWILLCIALFIAVVYIGDAQTAHEQIAEVLRFDWRAYQSGRPLHYWVGHYGAIPDNGLQLDTTEWVDGRLTLPLRVLLNCGLLGAMHLAWLIQLLGLRRSSDVASNRRFLGVTVVLVMLWGMWLVAPAFLTWRPHYLAGYERLHWFAYVPALVSVATAVEVVAQFVSSKSSLLNGSFDDVRPRMHPVLGLLGAAAVTAVIRLQCPLLSAATRNLTDQSTRFQ